ncbi:MAG: helix-turn-helix transcriptional regulator [Alphaproteobacteria bacterium]
MPQQETFDDLVADFHEAAFQPELWPQTLQKTADIFKVTGTILLAWPGAPLGAIWSEGLDDIMYPFFEEEWYTQNPRLERAELLRPYQSVITESDLFTPEELDTLPFHAEFINVHGFRWSVGTFVTSVDDVHTAFAFERKASMERFSPSEVKAISAFLPHMRQAGQVAVRLAQAHSGGMLDAFEAIGCGAVLIDYLGNVQRFNQPAERYIGTLLQISGGKLNAPHKESNDALQRLIFSLLQPPQFERSPELLAVLERHKRHPVVVYGMPLVRTVRDMFQYGKAILILVDPEECATPPELILQRSFNLTQAETRLALAMVQGRTLNEYADAQGVAIGTARVQLKSVMRKTSTHRQAELVSFLVKLSRSLPLLE